MRVTLVRIGLSVGLMIAGGTATAQAASVPATVAEHCVQQLSPPGQPVENAHCFGTYAAAISYLTGGRVQLPSDLGGQEPNGSGTTELDVSIAAAEQLLSTYVLSTEYVNANYGGASYTFTASSDCASTNYGRSSMPSGCSGDTTVSQRAAPTGISVFFTKPSTSV